MRPPLPHSRLAPRHAAVRAVLARHRLDGTAAAAPPGELGARLAAALPELGPVWTACGRHLAWRADLLPWADRRHLAALVPGSAAAPPEVCRRLVAAALGGPPEDHLAAWEETPYRVLPLEQRHRARAADGTALEVRLVPPAVRESLEDDLVALELLSVPLGGGRGPRAALAAAAIETFRLRCRESLRSDLAAGRPAESIPVGDGVGLRPPVVWRAAPGVLVVAAEPEEPAPDAEADSEYRHALRAFRLWRDWFAEAWRGGLLPAVHEPDDLAAGSGGAAYLGTAWVEVDEAAAVRLRCYLAAVAEGDADEAAGVLLEEAEAAGAAVADPQALRRRLRQAGTFREAQWTAAEGLAGKLLAHWRVLGAAGVPPASAFTAFFHGTAVVAATAGDGASPAAREALQEVRVRDGLEHLRAALAPAALGPLALRQARVLAELPDKLDRVLTRAADGRLAVRLATPPRRREAPWSRALAAACILAGLGLAGRAAVAAGVAGAEPLSLFALAAFGLWWWTGVRGAGGET